MSDKKLTEEEIVFESAATRLTMSIIFSTIREMIYSHMDEAVQQDKREVNFIKTYLDKRYKDFDMNHHNDNLYQETLVEKFQEHAESLLKDNSYQSKRDVFGAFVVVADYISKASLGITVGTDKYIGYHFYLCIRKAARYFAKTATEDQKQFSKEVLEHYMERKKETFDLLNIRQDAVSEL